MSNSIDYLEVQEEGDGGLLHLGREGQAGHGGELAHPRRPTPPQAGTAREEPVQVVDSKDCDWGGETVAGVHSQDPLHCLMAGFRQPRADLGPGLLGQQRGELVVFPGEVVLEQRRWRLPWTMGLADEFLRAVEAAEGEGGGVRLGIGLWSHSLSLLVSVHCFKFFIGVLKEKAHIMLKENSALSSYI